jgi:hypothetical protein
VNNLNTAQPEQTAQAVEDVSPLRALVLLFTRPSYLFNNVAALTRGRMFLFLAYCSGVAAAIDRLDQNLMKSELTGRSTVSALTGSWPNTWLFLLTIGVLYAALVWWIGGWWYRVRLSWSGVKSPDPFTTRVVYVYQDFVQSAPTIAIVVAYTLTLPSYDEAWASEEAWSTIILVFVVWSCITSYKAVRAAFQVGTWKSRVWFLITPLAFYFVVFVGVGFIYAMRDMQ